MSPPTQTPVKGISPEIIHSVGIKLSSYFRPNTELK